jgi:hypothetical protein
VETSHALTAHALEVRRASVPDALRSGPFTTRTAAVHGISTSALQGPAWRHIFREVWAHCELPDTRETRLAATRLVLADDAFVCGLTAAWLYGIDVQDARGDLVWVGNRNGRRCRQRSGCLVREITVTDDDLACLDDLVVTTPVRTAFDCARWLPLVEGVVVADALAHDGLMAREALSAYSLEHRPLRNVRRVDQVLELMEPLAESPMETRLRLLLVLAGLPRPKPQHVVSDASDRFVARLDLAYPTEMVAVEYDGSFHWKQRRADDRRRDALRALGWTVLVVSAEDYYRTPQEVVGKVRAALARRG